MNIRRQAVDRVIAVRVADSDRFSQIPLLVVVLVHIDGPSFER